jgi:hypothetical protein
VHLARVLANLNGGSFALRGPERRIAHAIGESEHLVFVLADGLGMNLVEGEPEDSFLKQHVALEMRSVFPSSTAPALTSLATGLWPAQHGVPAWFVYLPNKSKHVTALPFVERFSARPLNEAAVASELFSQAVLTGQYRRDVLALLPHQIANSVYSRYVTGGRPILPYEGLTAAVDAAIEHIRAAAAASFTYIYYPNIDAESHYRGPWSAAAQLEVKTLAREMRRLSQELGSRGRVVVSADHGQYEVKPSHKIILSPADELLELLVTPPSGEPNTPTLHARGGHAEDAARVFRREFGEQFVLLTPDEIEVLELMGPGRLSTQTRARLGDYMGLSSAGEMLIYKPDTGIAAMHGYHGGLTADEVRIPLIVA